MKSTRYQSTYIYPGNFPQQVSPAVTQPKNVRWKEMINRKVPRRSFPGIQPDIQLEAEASIKQDVKERQTESKLQEKHFSAISGESKKAVPTEHMRDVHSALVKRVGPFPLSPFWSLAVWQHAHHQSNPQVVAPLIPVDRYLQAYCDCYTRASAGWRRHVGSNQYTLYECFCGQECRQSSIRYPRTQTPAKLSFVECWNGSTAAQCPQCLQHTCVWVFAVQLKSSIQQSTYLYL